MIPSCNTYDRRNPTGILDPDENTQDITLISPMVSAWDVEAALAKSYPVIPGSLRFVEVTSTDPKVVAAFLVAQTEGSMMRGRVLVKTVVEQDKVTMGVDVEVTGLRRHPG